MPQPTAPPRTSRYSKYLCEMHRRLNYNNVRSGYKWPRRNTSDTKYFCDLRWSQRSCWGFSSLLACALQSIVMCSTSRVLQPNKILCCLTLEEESATTLWNVVTSHLATQHHMPTDLSLIMFLLKLNPIHYYRSTHTTSFRPALEATVNILLNTQRLLILSCYIFYISTGWA
jgi:hypothetical protein